ncbi:MAG TPA: hypothetical protein VN887_04940 [Candidatus Angelobacter sp.]|nr:hypothetical protein [Candidatus Angelobacter sp.]
MSRAIYLIAVGFGAGLLGSALSRAAEWENGPFIHEFQLTLAPGRRIEAMGPLFGREQGEEKAQWAFHPLVSHTLDSGADAEEFDLAYPLLTYDRFGGEYRFQILQVFSFSGGQDQQENGQKRFTVFPLYFQQRSPDPDLNYTAVVPFYGRLKNRLFRDEIRFAMFPLYGRSRKKDVVTDNYLYPFFHLRRGDSLTGWQFWPLLGYEHRDITTRTNRDGGLETVGGHKKFFALWPVYFNQQTGIGTENPEHHQALLPLYSYLRSPQRDSTTVLWPLGLTVTDDRSKKYRELGAPWPLIVFSRGEGKNADRIWPLFSRAKTPILESDFFLWPLYKYNRAHAPPLDRERTRILFFLYSDLTEKNEETGTALRRTDLWPLFTAKRDHNGNERLQLLAPLEPLVPNNKSIERNYSPLWSVWRSESNSKTGEHSQSFLWNLYRSETTPTTRKCSLLFGLFQYQSGPEGKRLRMLYVPVVQTKQPSPGRAGS